MDANQIQSDIAYVRETVSRAEPHRSPAGIPLLWAAIVAVGFPLIDFAPTRVGLFWAVAGPVGFVVSCFLGWRDAKRRGQLNRAVGMRWAAHWGSLLVAIFLAVLLLITRQITPKGLSSLIVLLLSMAYVLAGIHLERRLAWIGLLSAAGYVVVLFVSGYVWSVLGGVLAIALVAAAFVGGPNRATAV